MTDSKARYDYAVTRLGSAMIALSDAFHALKGVDFFSDLTLKSGGGEPEAPVGLCLSSCAQTVEEIWHLLSREPVPPLREKCGYCGITYGEFEYGDRCIDGGPRCVDAEMCSRRCESSCD